MHTRTLALALVAALLLLSTPASAQTLRATRLLAAPASGAQSPAASKTTGVPAPSDVLGFTPGDDRKLAGWAQTVEYYRRLAAASPRVRFEELGKSTLAAPFDRATLTAPKHLEGLAEDRRCRRRLAHPR